MAAMYFRMSSGCRAGAWPATGETRQPQRLPYKQHAFATALRQERRSVCEKTLLQNQFSERKCAGWAGVEQQRRNSSRRMHNERAMLNGEIRVAEFRIIACPIFRFRKNEGAQDFAALHLRGLFLLLCWLGVKRALGLRLAHLRRHSGERAMIRDRDPGTDRNRNAGVSRNRIHRELQSLTQGESQTFSSESRIGVIAADGVLSGGTTSGTVSVEICEIRGCSIRVAMSIAVKSKAPASK